KDDAAAGFDPLAPYVASAGGHVGGEEFTLDAQYSLWANVLSRVEIRWDRVDAHVFDANGKRNAFLLAAQVIYQF
ncbi:MAG TPA: hypothetical protein VK840_01055, partial [Candidatus Dormibacteraeota bacterium]|nr:hypothetical protein [Candidatus Dormibacteraeota bacterium]